MTDPYLRFPHLHDDLLAFVAADDVWLAPVEGGRAWRLTDEHAPAVNPRFSPDGAYVAWAAARGQGREVFVTPVDGGPMTQLTYWGHATTAVVGWTEEGRVLVSSAGGESVLRDLWLKAIDLDGAVERLPYGPASALALGDDGTIVVGSAWNREPAHWKRYRGGTAPQLWIDRGGTGEYERLLPRLTAGLAWPMWLEGRVAFVSDHDGVGNLFSVAPDGTELRAHTHHDADRGYVRNAASDGHRIVYHALGYVYVMDDLDAEPRRVPVRLGGTLSARDVRSLVAEEELTSARPTHDGAGAVAQLRGQIHYVTVREGPARALGASPGVRVRDSQPLGRTALAVFVTDAEGEDALEVTAIDGTSESRRLAGGNLGRVLSLQGSPAGDRVAAVSHDGRVLVIDVETGQVDQVGLGPRGEPKGLAFSPDGRWLAWSQPIGWQRSQLHLADLAADAGTRPDTAVTSGRFADFSPAFSPDGQYLHFLSNRTFDPVYDRVVFQLGFPTGTRPYLIALLAETPAPFGPSVDGWPLHHPKTDDHLPGGLAEGPSPAPGPPPPVEIDLEGFEERLVAFPVPAGDYEHLSTVEGGLLWLHAPVHGVLGADRAKPDDPPPKPALERF
ncbi:MAG: peptidase S41, partial [Actinomycetota bacterium]|nr:peptidase S41 [Actinomycetota bacterium]